MLSVPRAFLHTAGERRRTWGGSRLFLLVLAIMCPTPLNVIWRWLGLGGASNLAAPHTLTLIIEIHELFWDRSEEVAVCENTHRSDEFFPGSRSSVESVLKSGSGPDRIVLAWPDSLRESEEIIYRQVLVAYAVFDSTHFVSRRGSRDRASTATNSADRQRLAAAVRKPEDTDFAPATLFIRSRHLTFDRG